MLDGWMAFFWGELVLSLALGWGFTWWRCHYVLNRYRALEPTRVTDPASMEVDSVTWAHADETPAQNRAQLRRSVQQLREAVQMVQEASSQTNALGMDMVEAVASAVTSVTRAAAEAEAEGEEPKPVEWDSLLEPMQKLDPLVNQLLEQLDQIDSGIQTLAGELEGYGESYAWEGLAPDRERVNALLQHNAGASSMAEVSQSVQLPPGLAQAIDEAII